MNRAQYFMRKHSKTILTGLSSVGVVTTTVLAVKATPKALSLIAEAEMMKGRDLTRMETVRVAWKPYVPAVLTGFSTIACILGINYLSTRSQASMASAYALLNNSYKEYRKKVNELYGEDADTKVKTELAESHLKEYINVEDEKMLFFDFQSMRHFTSTMQHVMEAECAFLDLVNKQGYASLNEYYNLLGIPPVSFGERQGWFDMERIDPYRCEELEFIYENTTMKNGMKCITIDTNVPPVSDYIL